MKNNNISKIFDLKNKTIILTGSAGRLGSRFAHVLSNAQANVILVDIEQTKNKQLEKKINSIYNTNSLSVNTDITKEDQVKKLIDIVIKKYKKIDGLINNAHILLRDHSQRDASFENYPLDLWEKMTSENLRAAFLCSREVGKIMVKQKHGVILNI